jgi:hypothetical protein
VSVDALYLKHRSASGVSLANRWELNETGILCLSIQINEASRKVSLDIAARTSRSPSRDAFFLVRIDEGTWRVMPATWTRENDRASWTTKAASFDAALPMIPIILTNADKRSHEILALF